MLEMTKEAIEKIESKCEKEGINPEDVGFEFGNRLMKSRKDNFDKAVEELEKAYPDGENLSLAEMVGAVVLIGMLDLESKIVFAKVSDIKDDKAMEAEFDEALAKLINASLEEDESTKTTD